jgi:hypothetical protein
VFLNRQLLNLSKQFLLAYGPPLFQASAPKRQPVMLRLAIPYTIRRRWRQRARIGWGLPAQAVEERLKWNRPGLRLVTIERGKYDVDTSE